MGSGNGVALNSNQPLQEPTCVFCECFFLEKLPWCNEVWLVFTWLLFQGGFWIPGDGVVNPTDVVHALSKRAKEQGKTP